jgi:hypothetical protein
MELSVRDYTRAVALFLHARDYQRVRKTSCSTLTFFFRKLLEAIGFFCNLCFINMGIYMYIYGFAGWSLVDCSIGAVGQ